MNFFYKILDALNEGKIIRDAIVIALKILGIIVILVGIYFLIDILKVAFSGYMSTSGTLGGIIFALFFIAAVIAISQILFYRSKNIQELGDSPFTVIPIFSIIIRALGEIYATLGVAVGLGGCIVIWFAGHDAMRILRSIGVFFFDLPTEATFLGGLLFLVLTFIISFVVLIVFYFLAESIVVIVDIAKNVRLLIKQNNKTSEVEAKSN